jgi:hypothetical protein
MERLSMHPFFYNRFLGIVPQDTIETGRLEIGHDAWIGAAAIITPGCSRIGIGAVVGAGAVVTKNVDDFAVVAGNPAKLIRYRFNDQTRGIVRESRWWDKTIDELKPFVDSLTRPLSEDPIQHPLISAIRKSNK